jgi:oxygen-independent coproporphyrinogen-3 oxidase
MKLLERLRPPQATIYMLELNEGSYFHQHKYQFGKELNTTDEIAEAYRQTCFKMDDLGYEHYEISSFYRKDRPYPRHNTVYWEGDKPFAAFGMGATSLLGGIR